MELNFILEVRYLQFLTFLLFVSCASMELDFILEVNEDPYTRVPHPLEWVKLKYYPLSIFEDKGWETIWWNTDDLDRTIAAIKAKMGINVIDSTTKFGKEADGECYRHLHRFFNVDQPFYIKVATEEQAHLVTYILTNYAFEYVVVQVHFQCQPEIMRTIEMIFKNARVQLYLSEYMVPRYSTESVWFQGMNAMLRNIFQAMQH